MIGAVFGPCFVLRGARGELHGRYGALLCSVAEALAVFAGTPRGAAGGAICTAFAAAAAGVADSPFRGVSKSSHAKAVRFDVE